MLLFTFVLISPIISAKVVAVKEILTEIIAISIDDGVQFQIKGASDIMEEMEYSGVRLSLEALLDNSVTP